MKLEILTPETKLFLGEASYVQIPGSDGQLGVLDNHAPLITSLGAGSIRIKAEGTPEEVKEERLGSAVDCDYLFEVNGGTVEILNNNVVILAE
ncbi:MAG: F0F1 ATP synthase subunit epsilon [Flavobacteriales bacterium]